MTTNTWILTFNRPHALNRLIESLGKQGIRSNVFSNNPKLEILTSNKQYVDEVVINTLNSTMSNAWCARSWNSIMLRSWHKADKLVLIQDDTHVSGDYGTWFDNLSKNYDFAWGPGGDQWHYLTFDVFKKVGYWDERYIGCYCADADYLKRIWFSGHDQSRMAIHEEHNWGLMHNPSGIKEHVLTEMHVKTIDPTYQNQHWQLEEGGKNPTIFASQQHFTHKWGIPLDTGKSLVWNPPTRQMGEIDWYPWFTKIHDVKIST